MYGDNSLQKTIVRRIQRAEKQKKIKRLEVDRLKELKWLERRKAANLQKLDSQDDNGLDMMTELMRCMTLMMELECSEGMWMTWQPLGDEMVVEMELETSEVGLDYDGV